jgi:hypothetical protein
MRLPARGLRRPGLVLAAAACLTLLVPAGAAAQEADDSLGSWLMYFGQNRIGERSSIHTEAQFRFWEVGSNRAQSLFRVGFNHDIDADNMVTGGYAFIDSRPPGGRDTGASEHRIWQQYVQRARVGKVAFEHRYRFEQRWISRAGESDFGLRGRYRLMLTLPFGDSPWFASVYDEIFLRVEERPFDQNRLYGALGYRVDSKLSLQAGYLLQSFDSRSLGALQLAVFFNPDLR